jgi:hypothetical protein
MTLRTAAVGWVGGPSRRGIGAAGLGFGGVQVGHQQDR